MDSTQESWSAENNKTQYIHNYYPVKKKTFSVLSVVNILYSSLRDKSIAN